MECRLIRLFSTSFAFAGDPFLVPLIPIVLWVNEVKGFDQEFYSQGGRVFPDIVYYHEYSFGEFSDHISSRLAFPPHFTFQLP